MKYEQKFCYDNNNTRKQYNKHQKQYHNSTHRQKWRQSTCTVIRKGESILRGS